MMTYRPDRRAGAPKAFRSRQLFLIVLLIFVLTFAGRFLNQSLGGIAFSFSQPFWSVRNATASAWQSLAGFFSDKGQLIRENQDLKTKLSLAQVASLDRDLLAQENLSLRRLLGRDGPDSDRLIARVLTGWQAAPFDLLAIDLGSESATRPIDIGTPVLAAGNIWLGEVAQVYAQVSKVKLLSMAGQLTPTVLGAERVPITLTGRGGGNFVATIPRGVSVRPGELALASGSDRDWIVAVVGAVQFDATGTEQKVFLRQPVRASSLHYVELATQ